MPGKTHQSAPAGASPKSALDAPSAAAVREHLAHVIGSPAFKGSRRSQEFFKHIVETTLRGNPERLKERVLGVELFGRLASYDTGEDAIVRVTASDVRRRLHQYYSEAGAASEIRIELPPGSYAPEFRHVPRPIAPTPIPLVTDTERALSPAIVVTPRPKRRFPRWAIYCIAASLCIAAAAWGWSAWNAQRQFSPDRVQPWASMLLPEQSVRIIYADPEILFVQNLLGFRLKLADYANRRYVPETAAKTIDHQRLLEVMRGLSVAAVDVGITMNIDHLASKVGRRVETRTARSVQAGDFKTGDHFILLGSPRSNPWSALFEDKLDFKYIFDENGNEIIENTNIQHGERARYIPSPANWGTGEAFGILAFIANPGQNGRVLIIAGSNREATEASGKLATDTRLLTDTLKSRGIDPYGAPVSFQILLRVATMAGSPRALEVIACHLLKKS